MNEGVGEGEDCTAADTQLRTRLGNESSEPRPDRGSEVTTRKQRNRRVGGQTVYNFKTSGGRTSNAAEVAVVSRLESTGWTVFKNGWPDLFAVKDGEARFIEVKPYSSRQLSRRQHDMATALKTHLGVDIEIVTP